MLWFFFTPGQRNFTTLQLQLSLWNSLHPGLAHFVEHMVFMGSERYPGEGEFDQFVQRTGGDANAATDAESTVFHFYTQRKHLREGTIRDGTELGSSSKTRSRLDSIPRYNWIMNKGAGFFGVVQENTVIVGSICNVHTWKNLPRVKNILKKRQKLSATAG